MKDGKKWVIVDTETNTLYPPVYVIEIAAQLMEGWTPVGEPFRIFINHGVKIDPDAKSIHGYDEKFLDKNGINPIKAYEKFRDYAQDYPLVAHNLAFDWNRALTGEYERLGIDPIGTRGFCTLMLSRRVIPEVDNHRLDTLKKAFNLSSGKSHQALSDVICVVQLIAKVIAPRLERISLETYDMVDTFSKKDTKQCHHIIQTVVAKDTLLKYHIARQGKIIGEYSLTDLSQGIREGHFEITDHYWNKNMGDTWGSLSDIIHTIQLARSFLATEEQIVYLKWLGFSDGHLLSNQQAAEKIKILEVKTKLNQGRNWNIEKLILHPELFPEELEDFTHTQVLGKCYQYYIDNAPVSSRHADQNICRHVIDTLNLNDPTWWSKGDVSLIFISKLGELYPETCNGKSISIENKLPLSEKQKFEEIIRVFTARAGSGDNVAQLELGKSYLKIAKSLKKGELLDAAYRWLNLAAISGLPEAQNLICFELSDFRYGFMPDRVGVRAWAKIIINSDMPSGEFVKSGSSVRYKINPIRSKLLSIISDLEGYMDTPMIKESDLRVLEITKKLSMREGTQT